METMEMVRVVVREELERWGAPTPAVLQFKRAARELDVSLTKLKGLIREGAIQTIVLGRRKMVPRREIERIASAFLKPPAQRKNRPHRKTQEPERSPKEMADAFRAKLRKPKR